MRINQFIARATGMSRRAADRAVEEGKVKINDALAAPGADVGDNDTVALDDLAVELPAETLTIMLNKPVGYVCSRDGQGSKTIYDLLPIKYHELKPIGRLDKDSSGLLLLTNDGDLANQLTHPRYHKEKVYEVELDKPLSNEDKYHIEQGVKLDDGPSKLQINNAEGKGNSFTVTMAEGRNRQIRRTFAALGYEVNRLNRTAFGSYNLNQIAQEASYQVLD